MALHHLPRHPGCCSFGEVLLPSATSRCDWPRANMGIEDLIHFDSVWHSIVYPGRLCFCSSFCWEKTPLCQVFRQPVPLATEGLAQISLKKIGIFRDSTAFAVMPNQVFERIT